MKKKPQTESEWLLVLARYRAKVAWLQAMLATHDDDYEALDKAWCQAERATRQVNKAICRVQAEEGRSNNLPIDRHV